MQPKGRHPWLNMAATTLFDLSLFGFAALAVCRNEISGMHMLPLAAALLAFGAFDLLLLRTPRSLKSYFLLNLLPAVLWTVLLLRCTEFAVPGILPRILLAAFGLILPARRMYISAAGTEPKAQILFVDGAAILLILVRWVQHYLHRPDLDTVFFLLLLTIVFEIFNILGERVERSGEAAAPASALLLIGVLLCLFAGLSAAAVSWGEGIAAAVMGILQAVWRAGCRAAIFAVTLLGRFLYWIASLFPEAESGMLPMEEQPQMVMALEEAMERPDTGLLLILGLVLGLVLTVWLIRVFAGYMLGRAGIGRQTVTGVRRRSRIREGLKTFLRRLRQRAAFVFTVLFRGRTVPGLLLRAEWFGRRRLCGRKGAETIREYLTRIAGMTEDAGAAEALADWGEQWLYAAERPELPEDTVRRILTAFPLF